jgi:multiple sugar transport system substrate-binding protein
MIGGANFTLFSNTDHVKEGLKFISFVSDPRTQVKWYKISNDLPSRKKAWNDSSIKDNQYLKVFGKQLQNAQPTPQITEFENMAQELLHSLEKVNVGNADLKSTMKAFEEKANSILEQ